MASDIERVNDDPQPEGRVDGYFQPELDAGSPQQIFAYEYRHSGPLPSAADLAAYKAIDPELPREILEMAKREQSHRHQMDRDELREGVSVTKRGQSLGFWIAVVVMAVAVVLGLAGQPWVAGLLGTVDLVALVTVFVLGRSERKPEQ
ncbi:hypothetical protein SCMU_27830 [Sinomonas cyclohexanicum]|uniref:DUF2335 domain-containing protein n=1 Tax=Sinomonas cyclohexanicum TaxID=322009 RepID=A0ABM7PY25_SINCY|nr:DUF2335 domain-containing protein [Corynebacterium cyclohexanicum]BCT76941.1 hypothetical protein SCMU_27830 [Corynebacterium cyclohexanicum]